jgi:acetylornithine deacetylase
VSADPLSEGNVLEVLQSLISIRSVNPALAPDEGPGEREIAKFVRDWLGEAGIEARLEEVAPGRPNVVASLGREPADVGGRTLVLCGHLDTVGTAGMTIPPFAPTLKDGRVYGRGSYDMKGGVAAILSAARSLAPDPPPGRVLLALVADEEHASLGAADFVKCHHADACILTESSEGSLVLAHKGFVWIDVRTEGRAAHGSRFDLGASAISGMAPIITALTELDRSNLRRRTHPLVGPASLHCARIEGGVGRSTYAPACRLEVERRTLPGESPERVLQEIREVIAKTGVHAEVSCAMSRSPSACASEERVVRSMRDAIRSVLGASAPETGVGYWMDAAIFSEAGIPSVNFGPSGFGAHEAVEWVDVGSVVGCARVLVEATRTFLQGSG